MSVLGMMVIAIASLSAQYSPGSWTIFPMSGEYYDYVLDTPDKFFYMTGGSLYSYDKEYQETFYYSPGSSISDSGIAEIYYNNDSKYVLVVYENSNIDLIYNDGSVVNLPEIKDANLSVSKTINHIMFRNNRIYVATDFGLVVYDDKKHQVIESGIFNVKVDKIMATDEYLLIFSDYKLYYSPINERHNSFEKFEKLADTSINIVQQVDSNTFVYVPKTYAEVRLLKLDVPKKLFNYTVIKKLNNISQLLPYKDGFFAIGDGAIVLIDKEGKLIETVSLSSEIDSQLIGMWEGTKSVWAADENGVANYDISTDPITILSDKFKASSSMQFKAGFTRPSWDGLSVYVTSIGMSDFHPAVIGGNSIEEPFICEKYDWATRSFTQVHPYGVLNTSTNSQKAAEKQNSKLFFGGAGATAIDPIDPELIYHANNFEGLVIVKNKEVLYEYNKTNSPLFFEWGTRVFDVVFDPMGNLWVGMWRWDTNNSEGTYPSQTKTVYKILPVAALEKLRKDPSSVKMSDWMDSYFPSTEKGKCDMYLLFSSKSNKGLYVRGSWDGPIIGLDTKGTSETTDDSRTVYRSFLDTDGSSTWPTFRTCVVEDKRGNFWIGTSGGIYVVEDLNQLGSSSSNSLMVRRPKVARNDGTNYADYLLSSETILNIAVDPSNRKWITTQASGIYLVSEDGTEILQQFTTDNSPLMSNCVYTAACDPNGNDVLFGTPHGMFLYSSTASPAAEDYSDVKVYPNPVRPDYMGWITIEGLMENSLVKIADMQGNVFWQGNSEGGMAVWDGCNSNGERVRAGVYLVLASMSDGNSSEGVVAKIVVIN